MGELAWTHSIVLSRFKPAINPGHRLIRPSPTDFVRDRGDYKDVEACEEVNEGFRTNPPMLLSRLEWS